MDDRTILEFHPLPLARGYRRYRNAAEVRERHDAAYYLFEIYLKYLASTAIARYLAGEARDHRVNAALKGLARPSLGEWVRFLRECLRFLIAQGEPDAASCALAGIFEGRDARSRTLVRLYNDLRAFRTERPSDRDKVSLEMLLEELVPYRNKVLGHGAPLEREHYQQFADLLGKAFAELLGQSPFLTALRLVVFDSVHVEEGSRIECGVIEYMGVHPIRREKPHTMPYGSEAPRRDVLYLLSDNGAFLSLDPLLVAYREDVFFLNEAGGSPSYLSYATGEHYTPSNLGEDQRQLFERVLGYRVDETHLTRIGGDVAAEPAAPSEAAQEGAGQRLGDYRIVREIGRGAMGAVFEAVQESLGRRVALKVLPGSFALDARRVERFRREARATARVHHPGIVPVYEVGEAGGAHYYAMEYVDGPPLGDLVAQAREQARGKTARDSSACDPTYIARAVEQTAALAEGLEEAHRLGLIHRDIKPSNILVDSGGRYVLVDFGLVREEAAETLTRSGEMVGTLAYMSPEQVSRRKVDARSDVYSLGATLYEVLTLKAPFEGESEHETQTRILFKDPAPPRTLNPRIHRDLETIILHALEKDPDRRYASAADLAADLRRFLRYEPIRARPPSVMTRLGRKARKHRGKVVVGLAFAALLGGLLTLTRTPIEVRLARILFEMKEQRDLGRSGEAFARGMEAAGLLEGRDREDPKLKPYVKDLDAIMSEVCRKVDIETTPEGARITVGPNEEFPRPVASWSLSGISPLKGFPVPRGYNRWSVSKEGYPTYEFLRAARGVLRISLDDFKAAPKEPEEMVYVAGGADPPDRGLDIGLGSSVEPLPLPGFYIDLLEVTNRRYKEFVDEGGYEKPEYWEEGLKECTKTWDEVRKVCIEEKTGKPGPRFWVNGMYPDGQDAYPVCGVSWFEAAAYARYRGKRLPSVHHWAWAVQASGSAPTLVPSSNIGKEKLARAGEYPGRTGFGARDMAGNVREWCWNESGRGRFILGGAWSDADYMSTLAIAKDPFDRDRGNGFRCILPAGGAEPPAEVWNRIDFPTRDYGKDEPMEDAEFQDVIRRYYTIADPGELDPRPDGEPVEEESLWIRERITFKAAYSDERVAVILFKPKGRPPPWQPILFVPTAGAILLKDSKKGELDGLRHIRALLAGGWAIIYPVFKYTYERGGGGIPVEKWPKERDLEVCPPFVHDVSRCIDYIRTRPDFDAKNVGYYGVSLGACIAPLGLALETRIRAAVLVDGGLLLVRKLWEFEFFHYCPRVKAQVLMLNGKFDPLYPYELSQKPMFDWLRLGNALDEHDTSSATFHTYDPSLRIPKTQAWFEKHLRAGALAAKP